MAGMPNAVRTIVALLCLFACSCAKRVLSSVCMPDVSSQADIITLTAFLSPRLPEGAIPSGDFSTGRLTVIYRDQSYDVIRRKRGQAVCLDFQPPIPVGAAPPTARKANVPWDSRLAECLAKYSPYVLCVAALMLFWRTHRRRTSREAADVRDTGSSKPLVEVLPDLALEIERLLKIQGEPDLAAQVIGLRILDRCRCGDDFCSTFYVQPQPEGAYGPNHRNIVLEPERGALILDLVDEQIACVEVLYRDEIRERLHSVFP
jgi:hypothetical protein